MDKPKEKKRIWDKLIMGAVIGGAIGSVLGASIAPKKGSETREDAKNGFKKFFNKVKGVFSKNEHVSIDPRLGHNLKELPKDHTETPKN